MLKKLTDVYESQYNKLSEAEQLKLYKDINLQCMLGSNSELQSHLHKWPFETVAEYGRRSIYYSNINEALLSKNGNSINNELLSKAFESSTLLNQSLIYQFKPVLNGNDEQRIKDTILGKLVPHFIIFRYLNRLIEEHGVEL